MTYKVPVVTTAFFNPEIQMTEIYISTDIETDGPIPGPHSLLSLGSAAFLADGTCVSTFSENLNTLPGAIPHPSTAKWWESQPEAYAASRKNANDPAEVTTRYKVWLASLPGRPLFVGYPASFDFMFVYWYLIRFTGDCPFGHSAIDIRSYAMALRGSNFEESSKAHLPSAWLANACNSHLALEDAIEQGELFCNMLKYRAVLGDLAPVSRIP